MHVGARTIARRCSSATASSAMYSFREHPVPHGPPVINHASEPPQIRASPILLCLVDDLLEVDARNRP